MIVFTRRWLIGTFAAVPFTVRSGLADGRDAVREAEERLAAGRAPIVGALRLEAPDLAPNGSLVAVSVEAASPMTPEDHVTAIHLLATSNPWLGIATFRFTPQSGSARATTRVRLARSQRVIALAETSAGMFHRAERFVEVAVGGCGA